MRTTQKSRPGVREEWEGKKTLWERAGPLQGPAKYHDVLWAWRADNIEVFLVFDVYVCMPARAFMCFVYLNLFLNFNFQDLALVLSSRSWDTSWETLLCNTVCMYQFGCDNTRPPNPRGSQRQQTFLSSITCEWPPTVTPVALSHDFLFQGPSCPIWVSKYDSRSSHQCILKLLLKPRAHHHIHSYSTGPIMSHGQVQSQEGKNICWSQRDRGHG